MASSAGVKSGSYFVGILKLRTNWNLKQSSSSVQEKAQFSLVDISWIMNQWSAAVFRCTLLMTSSPLCTELVSNLALELSSLTCRTPLQGRPTPSAPGEGPDPHTAPRSARRPAAAPGPAAAHGSYADTWSTQQLHSAHTKQQQIRVLLSPSLHWVGSPRLQKNNNVLPYIQCYLWMVGVI